MDNCCSSVQVCRFRVALGRIRILKLTDHFSGPRNLTPYQFAIHRSNKEKEKQLEKATVFQQFVFATRES